MWNSKVPHMIFHYVACCVVTPHHPNPPLIYMTGFWKTDPNRTIGISRITNFKYLTHCESLLLGCSHAKLAV